MAWRLSNTLEASFCVEALEEALERYGAPEIFNTDQGSQFTSLDFTSALTNAGIKISMDGKAAPGLEVITISSVTGDGLQELRSQIRPGHTVVLVGSSGVGKSTLINRLLGRDRQPTGAVRESDDRGRHITTRRELLQLPEGGLVIDTPGLHEVGLLADEEAVQRGDLDADGLDGFHRLVREQASATRRTSEHEQRAHERATSGHYRETLRAARRFKGHEN